MKNQGIKFGLIYGGISIILFAIVCWTNPKAMTDITSWRSIVGTIVMIVCMFLAARKTRDAKGGFIPFGEAFIPPFITYVIGSLIGVLFLYILFNFVDPSLLEIMVEGMVELQESILEKAGMSEDQRVQVLEEFEEKMDNPYSPGSLAIMFFTNLFTIDVPVSAIIAAIVKKKEPSV
ncbi:MAG: DUF4199 domain-containing protein [Bacteroidota bacterium]